ncbi:MAG: hypothetical protein J1E36_02535 [Eubacterium sp.]|nr:hypothetical protein [Eubacterium sp.]
MNKNIKKYLSLSLSIIILLGCISFSFTAFGDDLVAIDASNFTDYNFRSMISERYDSNRDGYLSTAERNVSLMSIPGMTDDNDSIKTLKGIEYFAGSLTVLRCGAVNLEELDVSALVNLTSLTCMGNKLTSLDVSKNSRLVTLNCSSNLLTSLTFGSLSSLNMLHCYANKLENIDVSALVNLTDFRCDQNELTVLDVSKNTRLQEFTCSANHLTALDLSNNTALESVVAPAIGDQTTTAQARLNGVEIVIPFDVENSSRITSTSLDDGDFFGYSLGEFLAYNVNDIDNGVDYTYSTNLPNSEDMSVHIDVSRDFFQVSFYTAEDMTELINVSFVEAGGNARIPSLPQTPTCKAFDGWSEEVTNVTRDMQVYIIWRDDHSYELVNFENDVATISCPVCGDSFTVLFSDCINANEADDNYCEYIDVVTDGYINAKDYAKLIKMF